MYLQALNEELYDIIQLSPEEKAVAPVGAGKNMQKQRNSASAQPPTRPPKSHKTLKVSKVKKKYREVIPLKFYTEIVIISISKLILRTRFVLKNRKHHLCLRGAGTLIVAS